MAGARAALLLLLLLLHLWNLALAARGESGRPGCAPTSRSAQQTVGPGRTNFSSTAWAACPRAALVPSLRPPRRWASRVGSGRPDKGC